jgi:hypothetical protein
MRKTWILALWLIVAVGSGWTQSPPGSDGNFQLALAAHPGLLPFHADGFIVIQTSAKPSGTEIGIRGSNGPGLLTFLGFRFLFPEQAPMTSAKCRDGVMGPEKKSNSKLKILAESELAGSGKLPVELVKYSVEGRDGKTRHFLRGFIATGEICGDLEIYSDSLLDADDPTLQEIWKSYRLNPKYAPQFHDVFLYAQILYRDQMFQAAAPMFERSLAMLVDDKAEPSQMWRRVTTDQAGMAYGMSGNIPKARALFEAAIAKDPDYPLYYYNLACADAEEKKLADARAHLQQAFARKANMLPGESIPDPTKDDSFLPYKNNKEFWAFLEGLH